jgi:hypothetical protein
VSNRECYFCGRPAAKGHDPGCPGIDLPPSHRPVPQQVIGVDFGYAGHEVMPTAVMRLDDDGGMTVLSESRPHHDDEPVEVMGISEFLDIMNSKPWAPLKLAGTRNRGDA